MTNINIAIDSVEPVNVVVNSNNAAIDPSTLPITNLTIHNNTSCNIAVSRQDKGLIQTVKPLENYSVLSQVEVSNNFLVFYRADEDINDFKTQPKLFYGVDGIFCQRGYISYPVNISLRLVLADGREIIQTNSEDFFKESNFAGGELNIFFEEIQ